MSAGAGPLEPMPAAPAAGPVQPAVPVAPAGPVEPVADVAPVVAAEVLAAETVTAVRYVGLATRVLAFVIDAAVINLVAVTVGLGASLILSLFHLPDTLKAVLVAIGGVGYVLWSIGYFIVFWSTTGQTPGDRVMQIRVVSADGTQLKPRRSLVRCVGVVLAALPLFAGFVLILFDDKRRGFQDRFAGTLVIEAPQMSLIAARRGAKRAEYAASKRRV